MSRVEKTVFISYRRTNSFHALAVYQHLTALGYDVFYDVDSLRSGDWLEAIIENIKARAHFLILLTPSAVERFDEPNDVMRQEIETAIDEKRNIIPLMMESFDFSDAKPYLHGKLAILPKYNGIEIPVRFFKYAMQELHEKRLQQDIDTIIHPSSAGAEAMVQRQKQAAESQSTVTEEALSAEEWFERGNKDHEAGKYQDTIAAYSEAIRLKPDYAKAYNNRGISYRNLQRYDEAIRDYNEAIRLKPDDADAYNNRGNAYNDGLKRYDEAIRDYSEAIRLKPDYAEAYNNRGNAYNDGLKRYDEAIRDFNEAIRLKPDFAMAYYNRGIAYYNLGRYDEAIRDYDEAIRLKPDYAAAYRNRGVVYKNKGDLARANADYQRYIDNGGAESEKVRGWIRDNERALKG